MPVYNNDPTKVTANAVVLPKDDYEFIIGSPKSFAKKNDDGVTIKNYGIRYPIIVAGGPFDGQKPYPAVLYQHNPESESFSKQFLMAALGYDKGRDEEKRFDEASRGKDWSFDTDTGACGDAWNELTGKIIVGSFDTKMGDNQNEQQVINGWRKI
jgi:hypothetical protein